MDILKHLVNLTTNQKETWLQEHATSIEEGQYFRPYDGEDIAQTQQDFTLKSIEMARVEAEFDEIKAKFKMQLKVLKAHRALIMQNLMQKGEWLDGKQYLMDDQETGMMHYYDATAQIVSSRRLRPEERQISINSILRDGTN